MISALVLKGAIKTTEVKAKAVKGQIDKIVTRAKKGNLAARRQLLKLLDERVVEKLINETGPIFANRSSGFSQIVKIGSRKGDNAAMVLLRWVGAEKLIVSTENGSQKKEVALKEKEQKKSDKVKNDKKTLPQKRASKKIK